MNAPASSYRLAVCSWSLQPASPQELITKLAATGIPRVQLALGPLRSKADVWNGTARMLRDERIAIVSGMVSCVGENYSTLESIRMTGGIVPDGTWEENRANFLKSATLARELGLKLVTFHAGFVPHDERAPGFATMLKRLQQTAEIFADAQLAVALETGQETAVALAGLLHRLNSPNVGVNFDPANMILYDQGDPVVALGVLAPWIRQVHLKDAIRTQIPGTWGQEVALGRGEVDWPRFFARLREIGFAGDFVIEREAGGRRHPDIAAARDLFQQHNP